MRVTPEQVTSWNRASKTRNILARPLGTLIIDADIATKLLLETLEGTQAVKFAKPDTMVCVGVGNDCWQQEKKKLFAKYDIIDMTTDGWMVCQPKPENEVEVVHISEVFLKGVTPIMQLDTAGRLTSDLFYIIGQWGTETEEGPRQNGEAGDYLCRNLQDHSDIWIVKQFMFRSTYTIVGQAEETQEFTNVIPFNEKVA